MNKLREAAQAALKALEVHVLRDPDYTTTRDRRDIITDLRAALATPAPEPVQADQRPGRDPEIAGMLNKAIERSVEIERQQAEPPQAQQPQCLGDPGECDFHGACMYACGKAQQPVGWTTTFEIEGLRAGLVQALCVRPLKVAPAFPPGQVVNVYTAPAPEPSPGPWEFRKDGHVYSKATGERVCSVHSALPDNAGVPAQLRDLRANAKLIASAPSLMAEVERLRVPMAGECTWSQNGDDSDSWDTGCRKLFRLDDGTPTNNGMKFCCFCGKTLFSAPWQEENDE